MRGEAGSSVKVTVRPGATGEEREVSMVRAAVAVDPVSWTLVPGTKTALIRLDQFSTGAADDLKKALARCPRSRRRPVDPRPARQSGRLRQRGRRRGQPVPQERHGLRRAGRGRPRDDAPGHARRRRHRPPARRPGRWRDRQLGRDRVGRHPGRGRGPRSSGIKTFGTGTVLGEFPLTDGSALRVGTVEWLTPERPPDLARGDHPGRRRRARQRCPAARSRVMSAS